MDRLRKLSGQSIVYMVSFGLSRGLPVLLLPIYLAYLTPTVFGFLALSEVTASLAKVLFSQGLDAAVFHHYFTFREVESRQRYLGSVWAYLILSGIVLLAVTLAATDLLHDSINLKVPYHPYISLALIIAFLRSGFELVALQLLRAKEDAIRYALISVVSMVSTAGAQVYLLIVLGLGGEGVVIGSLLGAIVVAWVALSFLKKHITISLDGHHVRKGLAYGVPLIPHLLGHWLSNLSDRIVLERFVPISDVGVYSVGDRFRQGYAIIPWGMNSAIMPSFGRARNDAQERQRLPRLITYYCLLLAGAAVAVIAAAPLILSLIAPTGYEGLRTVIPWLVIGGLIYGLYFVPMNFLSQTIGETKEVSVATVISGAANVALNVLTVPRYGIVAAAINTAVSYVLLLGVMYFLANRRARLRLEYTRLVKIAAAVFLALAAGAILSRLGYLEVLVPALVLAIFVLVLGISGFATDEEIRRLAKALPFDNS